MMQTLRSRFAAWVAPKRARPIQFVPETPAAFFGSGIGTNQPSHETLLRESLSVADTCTRAIANRVASLVPVVKTSKRTTEGTLEDEILDDHVLKVLLDKPHRDFTRQQLMRLTAQGIVTVGEFYWLKVTNRLRVPTELQPMPPQFVAPIVRGGYIEGYQVQDGQGRFETLAPRNVIRFWFPDPETLYLSEGYLGPNGVNTDAARFASEHLRSFFQNDATPTTMLQAGQDAVSPTEDQWARYIEDWLRKHNRRSGQKVGAPVMIPQGWEAIFAQVQKGAELAPLLEYWQVDQLMNYGVPASILGRVVSGDRSSAETNAFVFDKHTVAPIASMIADTLTSQLASDFDDKIFIDWEEFVSEDKDFELRRESQDLTLKVRSPQQILADREADPDAAPWGEFPVGTFADIPYTGEDREPEMTTEDPQAIGGAPQPPAGGSTGGQKGKFSEADAITASNVLNGSQVESIVTLIQGVAEGLLDRDSAIELMGVAFGIESETASKIIGSPRAPEPEEEPIDVDPDEDEPRIRSAEARASSFEPQIEWRRFVARERKWTPAMTKAIKDIFRLQRAEALRKLEALQLVDRARAVVHVSQLFNEREWEELFFSRVEKVRKSAYLEAAIAAIRELGVGHTFQFSPTVANTLRTQAAQLITNANATTKSRIAEALAVATENGGGVSEMKKQIDLAFSVRRNNARAIARTELHRATQNAQIESFKQSGVVEWKRWNDNRDHKVRDSHHGYDIPVVPLEDPFILGSGLPAMHPGDSSLPAGEIVNCRCFVTPVFKAPVTPGVK